MALATVVLLGLALGAGHAWAGAYEEGISLFNKGQYQAAAARFQAALEQDSTNLEAMKRLGDCYFNLYSEEKPEYAKIAIEAYRKALEADPKDGVTRLRLAQMYSWSGDTENAVKQLDTLLEKEPENTVAMTELAEIYSWKADTYPKALEQIEKVLQKEPKNKRAHLIAARVYSYKSEHTPALKNYEAYLELDPEDDKIRLEYANELSMAKRFDDAIQQFNYLSSRRGARDQSLLGLAQAYYNAKRYADAMSVTDVVLEKEPNNSFAWRLKGLILAEQRRTTEAAEAFNKAIELNPEDIDAKIFLARNYAQNAATYPEAVAAYREVLKSQPDNVEIRTELANIYAESNNMQLAVEQYRDLLAKHPEDVQVRTSLVRALLKVKDYDNAIAEARNLLGVVPDDVDARLLMAETLSTAGKHKDALELYEDILDDKPTYLPAMIGVGWAHHQYSLYRQDQGSKLQAEIQKQFLAVIDRIHYLYVSANEVWHFNKAISLLTDAAEKYPDSPEPQLRLADVYAQHKAYKSSIDAYEKALQIDPRCVDAYLGMSWVYGQMGNPQKSVDAIRRAAQIDPTNAEILGGLGDAYAYQQDVSQAIEALEKAVALRFTDLDLHRRLANLYSQNRKYYEKAVRECDFILERDAADDDTRLLKARVLSWSEKYDEALVVYEEVLKNRPNDQDLYLETMKTKVYSGRADEVVTELRDVLTQNPDNINARLALANAYQVANNFELAEKEYRTVLQADAKNSHAHLGIATIYRLQEHYDRAVVEYREVLSSNPDSAEAYYGLGEIDRRNGRYERAIAMQKKVLELDPSNLNAFAELSYNHYLMSRRYVATTGQYHRAWWLLNNNWGDLYGVWGEYPDNIQQMQAILLDDPGNCDLRYLLGQELQNHNRNKEAVGEYRKLLQYCPNHIGGRIALADIFSYSPSTYAWAIKETLEIIKQEPDNYEAHLRLARLYAWSMQYNAAINQYAWCINARPDALDVRKELAETLAYDKRYKEAINQYQVVLAQDPTQSDARIELAKVFSYENRMEDAIREYELILQRDPNNFEASFALANLYSWDRRYYHRAIDLYRKLFLKYPKNVESRMEYARLLYERGEFSNAEEAYRNAIQLEPDNLDAHLMLGRIYIAKHENDKAAAEFQAVLDAKADNVDAHYYLAQMYAADEKTWDLALEHANSVLQVEPKNDEVREMAARITSFQEKYTIAAQHYEILVANNPNDDEFRLQYALNLSYAEQYSAALEQFQILAQKKPEDANIRLEMGLAYNALGTYSDAIVNLEYAVDRDPWNMRARKGLANAYKGAGNIDAAIDQYKRIVVVDPKDQEARDFLKLYNIEYVEGAFLDQWFNYPGKTMMAGGPGTGPPGMDEAEQRYRLRLAEELALHNRYKRARYIFEKLVKENPTNIGYRLALAAIYLQSGMFASARREYEIVSKIDPDNEDAKVGLARVRYESAPRIETTVGWREAWRFDRRNNEISLGSRFTYLFGDGGEAFGEVVGARHNEDRQDSINRVSPRVGLVVGLFGEVSARGEYGVNCYSDLPTTQNWLGALSTNIYDYVGLEGYAYRDDIQQTNVAISEGIGSNNVGGVLRVTPLDRMNIRGEYRHTWVDGGTLVDQNQADLISAALGYTFFDGPYFTPGYIYSYQTFDDELPGVLGVYFSPHVYQSHGISLDLRDDVRPNLIYTVGLVPAYNIVSSEITKDEDNVSLSGYGSLEWQIALKHRLTVGGGFGADLNSNDYFEYQAFISYMFIFGKHKGEWLRYQEQQQPQ